MLAVFHRRLSTERMFCALPAADVLARLVADYYHVATVRVADLEMAYQLTQNDWENWRDKEGVTPVVPPELQRSTSVGDLLFNVDTLELFQVASFGFERVGAGAEIVLAVMKGRGHERARA